MSESGSTGSLGEGVFYSPDDYAGLWKRFIILAVDGAVIVLLWVVLGWLWVEWLWQFVDPQGLVFSWVAIAYVYLVFVESSAIGTLGFRLTGVRIVTLKGQSPGFLRMTLRLGLWALGPFNPVIDLLWLGGDENKQSLRDKVAGTYVVRRDAAPIGRGAIHVTYYYFLGWSFVFPEVRRTGASVNL